MANAYHNLAGWLRDVRSIYGDRNDLADSYYWTLHDLIVELFPALAVVDGDDESAAEELESADDDDDVEDFGPGDSSLPGPNGGGARARREHPLGGSARMADAVPRESRGEARNRTAGDPADVARPGCGVKRVATVEVPMDVQRNRAAPAARAAPARSARTTRASSTSKGGKRRGKK